MSYISFGLLNSNTLIDISVLGGRLNYGNTFYISSTGKGEGRLALIKINLILQARRWIPTRPQHGLVIAFNQFLGNAASKPFIGQQYKNQQLGIHLELVVLLFYGLYLQRQKERILEGTDNLGAFKSTFNVTCLQKLKHITSSSIHLGTNTSFAVGLNLCLLK